MCTRGFINSKDLYKHSHYLYRITIIQRPYYIKVRKPKTGKMNIDLAVLKICLANNKSEVWILITGSFWSCTLIQFSNDIIKRLDAS